MNNYSIRKALENRTNMEDDRVAILEAQLAQAKLIAEEADKKYEEVNYTKPVSYLLPTHTHTHIEITTTLCGPPTCCLSLICD